MELRIAGFTPSLHHAEPIKGENRPIIDAKLGVLRFDGLIVLKSARIPALLLEAGVIAHPEEELDLENGQLRGRMVAALVEGLRSFCAISKIVSRNREALAKALDFLYLSARQGRGGMRAQKHP